MRHQLFLYGSFSEGEIHYGRVDQLVQTRRPGFVKGRTYRLPCGYPVLDVEEKESLISGTVVEIDAPESFFPILDAFFIFAGNKSLFRRVAVEALVENYSKVEVQAYVLNNGVSHYPLRKIEDGQWEKDMKTAPLLQEKLSQRQKDYLIKLSTLKGREILPVRLELYRELMTLGLIVDKGRRLALTPLGREVSLFLQ